MLFPTNKIAFRSHLALHCWRREGEHTLDGLVVTGLEIWATKGHIKAVQLEYSDGSQSRVWGDNTNTEGNEGKWWTHGKKTWKSGDRVTNARLANNYWGGGDRLGGVWFNVGDQELAIRSDIGNHVGGPQPLFSGILLGVYGSVDADINSMGFLFLKDRIKSAEIVEFKWPQTLDEMAKQSDNIQTFTINKSDFKNSSPVGSANQTWDFSNDQGSTSASTTEITNQHALTIEISTEVSRKASVPLLADGGVSVTTKLGYIFTRIEKTGETKGKSQGLTYKQGGILPAQRAMRCSATGEQGNYNTKPTAIARVTMHNG
ncbi:hypothetical protein DM02DRAFT_632118 [Periconia macrospinosa]|uniref:Jacalin-type lectin domain-containing protein n=1 Tax=Periconia macrospinosa TaxID=97972 RepID=A0A2V1DDY2_9PLEO|nr:hypothetical protein DM02DRAFT_632118 [Periconia macrospinosa]